MRSIKTKSTARKYKIGELYAIRFLDHILNRENLLTCEVCGRVIDEDETKLTISWWSVIDTDPDYVDNRERLTIAKSTITHSKLIKFI